MTYLLFILACFIVAFIYWKLKWSLMTLWLLLFLFSAIGLLIMPLNFELGLTVVGFCVGLMILIFFLGLIGIGVATIVAAPFVLLYGIIKAIFNK
jgi:hypothetical protein